MAQRVYLGQGIKYPYSIDQFGKIELQNDAELIKQSIKILFDEPEGTEFFREHYGSKLRLALFEPNDVILIGLLDFFIVEALEKWETRIQLIDIVYTRPSDQPSLVNCKVIYLIRQSNAIDSFVYPFYRELKN